MKNGSPVVILLALFISCFASLVSATAPATNLFSPILVEDINTNTDSSNPSDFFSLNGIVLFKANTELWRTDGTAAGTLRVAPYFNGHAGVIHGTVFFVGYDAEHGYELWKTDGTPAGTALVKDITPGPSFNPPDSLFAVGETLFFSAVDEPHGRELWKTDGTPEGTMLVKDLYSGTAFSNPGQFHAADGFLYFTTSSETQSHVWKSDGTELGTSIISITNARATDLLGIVGTNVFFQSWDTNGGELWVTDTNGHARLLKDIDPGPASGGPYSGIVVDRTLYFVARDTSHGFELWKTDGILEGTTLVKDINPGPGSSQSEQPHLVAFNHQLFFSARAGSTNSLWKTDGTESGTVLLRAFDSVPYDFQVIGDHLFFRVAGQAWSTDGTAEGTEPFAPNGLVAGIPFATTNGFFFGAAHPSLGAELWFSPTQYGDASLVKDINAKGSGSYPRSFTRMGDTLFFQARSNPTLAYNELWRADGTSAVRVIRFATNGFHYDGEMAAAGGFVFFFDRYDVLWRSDGTESGTIPLINISPAYGDRRMVAQGNLLFFGGSGYGLWRSDGTVEGTFLVKNIAYLTGLNGNNEFYFLSDPGVFGLPLQLWLSDGTVAGTVLVKDFGTGALASRPVICGTNLFLLLYEWTNNYNLLTFLWKTDGTPEGGATVKQLSYPIEPMVVAGGSLFFRDRYGTSSYVLWKSDGTESGTVPFNGIGPISPSDPLVIGSDLFYNTYSTNGPTLWKTDGSPTGTVALAQISIGREPGAFVNGFYLFWAEDAAHGKEVWVSDGTPEGTFLSRDLSPGSGSSFDFQTRSGIAAIGSNIYFTADDGIVGAEPWTIPVPKQPTLTGQRIRSGNLKFVIEGTPGARTLIESSQDFATWQPWQTNTIPGGGSLPCAFPQLGSSRFIRARHYFGP